MYSPLHISIRYLQYLFRAKNGKGHGVHSPFVFEFIRSVLQHKEDIKNKQLFAELEARRSFLLKDDRTIGIIDLGAGSGKLKNEKRKVSAIASSSLKPKKYAQLLFNICRHYGAKRIIELGTSFGVTTTYLASADPASRVFSFEGIPGIASVARESFSSAGLKNIELIEGNFDHTLPRFLDSQNEPFDLVFIDGNHRKEPTLRYFNWLLPHACASTIFVFDDIHWSREMEDAWADLKTHKSVSATIDLFFVGIVLVSGDFKEPFHLEVRY